MQKYFKVLCTEDVIRITDAYRLYCFGDTLADMGYDNIVTDEDFYDTLGAYQDLQETYQTLVYHHELYKKGKTPLSAFLGVCDGLSVEDLR